MKRPIPIFVLLLAAIIAAAPSAQAVDWKHSIDEARKADDAGRPMIVVFGAEWCGWCRKLIYDTIADPEVEKLAGDFLWVQIDVDKEQELAARFGVEGLPQTVVLDTKGRILGARGGYMPPDKFVEFVTESLKNPTLEEVLPSLIERFTAAATPEEQKEALARLVEQLARPDRRGRDEALDALAKKGASTLPGLLELMSDSRLSIRAAAAGVAKKVAQADLPFHPFAPPEARERELAAWREYVQRSIK